MGETTLLCADSSLGQPAVLQDGTFQFSITDEMPGVYQVLGSTNLQTWDPLATVINTAGTLP